MQQHANIFRFSLIRHILTLFSVLVINALSAQTPAWNWVHRAGGNEDEVATQLVCDTAGNTYTWGTFRSSSIQFGNITLNNAVPPSTNRSAYFVVKKDKLGNTLWAKTFDQYLSSLSCATIDDEGNYYLSGVFWGTLTLGGQSITYGGFGTRAFIVKYSPTGNVIWLKKKGAPSNSLESRTTITQLTKSSPGHILAIGYSVVDTLDNFPTGLATKYWLGRLDSAGNFIQLKVLGLVGPTAVVADANQNVYISGSYKNSVSMPFNTSVWTLDTIPGNPAVETYLAKFDSSLNFTWSKLTHSYKNGGGSQLLSKALAIDPFNNIFHLGTYQSDSIIFDATHSHGPIQGIPGNFGDYLVKYKPDGSIQWDSLFKRTTTGNISRTYAMSTDRIGNVYYGGSFNIWPGISYNGINATPVGNCNVFVVKFNTNGLAQWIQRSTTAFAWIRSMTIDAQGNIYTAGNYNLGNPTFGSTTLINTPPSQNNPYSGDLFIARIGNCNISPPHITPNTAQYLCAGDSAIFSSSIAHSYKWSTEDTASAITITSPGNYYVFGIDSTGCHAQSNVVEVSVTTIDTSVIVTNKELTATDNNATYQWIDCTTLLPVAGETNQLFEPTQNGSYAVVLTKNGCIDTSACHTITLTGVQEQNTGNYISVYPNPTNGNTTIQLNSISQGQLVLVDVLGKVQYQCLLPPGSNQLNLNNLPNGVYHMVVSSEKGLFTQKIVVLH